MKPYWKETETTTQYFAKKTVSIPEVLSFSDELEAYSRECNSLLATIDESKNEKSFILNILPSPNTPVYHQDNLHYILLGKKMIYVKEDFVFPKSPELVLPFYICRLGSYQTPHEQIVAKALSKLAEMGLPEILFFPEGVDCQWFDPELQRIMDESDHWKQIRIKEW